MSLTREQIRDGWIQQLVRTSGLEGGALSDEELRLSRERVLALHPPGADLAVFAYGSLIWNPAFHFTAREIAHVHGFHRRFCLWTQLGRGSPERPGLMLGLDVGGSCRGVLYTVAAAQIGSELEIVWRREMVTAAYRPSWVVATERNGPAPCHHLPDQPRAPALRRAPERGGDRRVAGPSLRPARPLRRLPVPHHRPPRRAGHHRSLAAPAQPPGTGGAGASGAPTPAGGHGSRLTALSCQRRSTRCCSRVKARKITIPVRLIRISAANMRGMLSR